jgi:hypothetical protein
LHHARSELLTALNTFVFMYVYVVPLSRMIPPRLISVSDDAIWSPQPVDPSVWYLS